MVSNEFLIVNGLFEIGEPEEVNDGGNGRCQQKVRRCRYGCQTVDECSKRECDQGSDENAEIRPF